MTILIIDLTTTILSPDSTDIVTIELPLLVDSSDKCQKFANTTYHTWMLSSSVIDKILQIILREFKTVDELEKYVYA